MATDKGQKWIFSRKKLEESPSRRAGIDVDKELSYRQQAANLIQDMGQRLSVNQLTINTAIVYMHRFYVYHSFTVFSRYAIAPTALFLAAKVEEQPKKLQHVLQICHACLHPDKPNLDTHSDAYMKQAQELVQNELVLLQTLGFDISVDHPHTQVVKCTQLVKASRDLSQMAYFMATNSLHLTTFCLLYKPTVVAAMCIHLSCKWSNYEIPLSSDGKRYWYYIDSCITESMLDTIITEFLKILNRCPTRLRKLKNYRPSQNSSKDGHDFLDEDIKISHHVRPSAQGPSQSSKNPPPSQVPPPPPKEKKQTLSIEEYKKALAAKTHSKVPPGTSSSHRPVQNHVPQASSSQAKKPDSLVSNVRLPSSQHQKVVPSVHAVKPGKLVNDVAQQHNDASQKNMMRPQHQHSKPTEQSRHYALPSKPHHPAHSQHKTSSDQTRDSTDELAMSKELEGRIQTEKLQKQQYIERHRTSGHSSSSTSGARPGHASSRADVHDQSRKASSEKPRDSGHKGHPSKSFKQLDSKQMAELYHKNPEKLRHYLKLKAQSVHLNSEEKNLYLKLQAKEEERRKKKAAAEAAAKQKASKAVEEDATSSPAGPPITLRIKLKTNASKPSSVAKIVSSDSDQQSSSSRKRAHDSQLAGHPSASKHAKKSDKPHHHGRTGSGTNDSKHRHSHHRLASGDAKSGIDDVTFQKSLHDAMNKVQQQHGSIPTVTLKRATNGKEAYFMSTASERLGFDPTAPVSAEVPDDIFEDDRVATDGQPMEITASGGESSADVSTPESGEIKESPSSDKSINHRSVNKVSSLFSPDASADSQLMRSSSGYHSGSQDNEFPPPVLISKHYVQ